MDTRADGLTQCGLGVIAGATVAGYNFLTREQTKGGNQGSKTMRLLLAAIIQHRRRILGVASTIAGRPVNGFGLYSGSAWHTGKIATAKKYPSHAAF
jgi:hypothetical protein